MWRVQRHDNHAYAPHFVKPKDEGWLLVLGETETREVVAMKRVTCSRNKRSMSVSVAFFAPELPCKVIYTLFIMSDSYLGLDQQYDIRLEVIPALESTAAVNGDINDDAQFMWYIVYLNQSVSWICMVTSTAVITRLYYLLQTYDFSSYLKLGLTASWNRQICRNDKLLMTYMTFWYSQFWRLFDVLKQMSGRPVAGLGFHTVIRYCMHLTWYHY